MVKSVKEKGVHGPGRLLPLSNWTQHPSIQYPTQEGPKEQFPVGETEASWRLRTIEATEKTQPLEVPSAARVSCLLTGDRRANAVAALRPPPRNIPEHYSPRSPS